MWFFRKISIPKVGFVGFYKIISYMRGNKNGIKFLGFYKIISHMKGNKNDIKE